MTRLKDKALKAYFKTRENLNNSSSKCSFTLFRTLVQPIILYGCEVWAPYLLNSINDNNFINVCDKPPGENLHIKFCKLILGVHKKATNHAVRGELGKYPLLLTMLSLSIKYWWKLNINCMDGSESLVIKALIENRKLKKFSWSSGIKSIFTLINNEDIWYKPLLLSKSNFNNLIDSCLKSVYDRLWSVSINNHLSKLRTYCQFKGSFSLENYVIILNRCLRSAFCKLRISAHLLMIEKGRYSSPKIPPENRLCSYCERNEIEDEFHFIMHCSLYNDLRVTLFDKLNDIFAFVSLSDTEKFNLIMSASDHETVHAVANYIKNAFDKRTSSV